MLYGIAGGESTNTLTFDVWDAAVASLPLAAQAFLALVLAVAARRRLRRGPAA